MKGYWIFVTGVVLGAVVALAFAFIHVQHRHQACHDAGGVDVRGTCIDRSVVLDP